MIITILQWFTQLFKSQYQTQLDQYISNKHPVNVADVEHLEREFSRAQSKGFL